MILALMLIVFIVTRWRTNPAAFDLEKEWKELWIEQRKFYIPP